MLWWKFRNSLSSPSPQPQELNERLRWVQVERESLESKMEAEKHVMRAQLRDLMEKQQAEVRRMTEQHQTQMDQVQQDLLGKIEELRKSSAAAPPAPEGAAGGGSEPADSASSHRIAELEGLMICLHHCLLIIQSMCPRNAESNSWLLKMDSSFSWIYLN